MNFKNIVLIVLLALLGLNTARNVRWGFRTGHRGYYVRALVNLSILIEVVLLIFKLTVIFTAVLVATIFFIIFSSGHVQELRKHEAGKRKQNNKD